MAKKQKREKKMTTHRMVTSMAGTTPRTEVYTITPELARKWLGQNTESNRNVSKRTVQAYAREMAAGRWQLTHQAIAFNQTGELVDGQHRLEAIVLSGATIKAMVTTGLPLEYNAPIDQGYNRRISQILQKPGRWVSCVRNMWPMETGDLRTSFRAQIGQIEELAERHGSIIDKLLTMSLSARVPVGVVSACAFAYPIDPDTVLNFFRQVVTGELLERGDPAYSLRSWMLREHRRPEECVLATCSALKYALTKERLARVSGAAKTSERDGYSNYAWLCAKRRKLHLPGTPTADTVPIRGNGPTVRDSKEEEAA